MIDGHTVVWVDGRRVADGDAHVSARDRGFTLADGAFETMKARSGRVFRLADHVARLDATLRALAIPVPAEMRDWIEAAVRAADLPDLSIRLTVTRGVAPGGLVPPLDPRPTVVVTVAPFPSFNAAVYEEGLSARVASGRRNEYSMTAGMKTLAYTDSVAALLEARGAGADEALFLDTSGHCSEGTASNLFAVVDDSLLTPPPTCAALPGITRAAVMELARAAGVRVDERAFGLDELIGAHEAFLTSSVRGVAPLTRVDGRVIGSGMPGPMTRRMIAAYAALVERECAA